MLNLVINQNKIINQDDQLSPKFNRTSHNDHKFNTSELQTKIDMPCLQQQHDKEFWESDLVEELRNKRTQFKKLDQKTIVKQHRRNMMKRTQLYSNKSISIPNEFEFENLPPPQPFLSEASKLISQIYQKKGDKFVEKRYKKIKQRLTAKRLLEPNRNKESSKKKQFKQIVIKPKNLYQSLDKFSKSQRSYHRQYQSSLADVCFYEGLTNKPLESAYCVEDYIHSQICPSGLATHNFNSAKAQKRVTLINTESTGFKEYPYSPRTLRQLEQIDRKKNLQKLRFERFKSIKDKQFDEYQQTFLNNTLGTNQSFLKEYLMFKEKKTKIFGSRLQQLQDIINYMQSQNTQVDTAHDIVSQVHHKRNPTQPKQVKKQKHRKLINDNDYLKSRQAVQTKRLYLKQVYISKDE